jgi:hypothetical protein
MIPFLTQPPRRRPVRFSPCVEGLEERQTPAATVMENQATGTLVITSVGGDNVIQITDTGTGKKGNVMVFGVANPDPGSSFYTNKSDIHSIIFDLRQGGRDGIAYLVSGNLANSIDIGGYLANGTNSTFLTRIVGSILSNVQFSAHVIGGASGDQFIAQIAGDIQANASLNWTMTGGAGADKAWIDFPGNMLDGASLNVSMDLGSGDDGWDALLQGKVSDHAQILLTVNGGAGNDVLDSTFRTQLLSGSRMVVNYGGNAGRDVIRINAGSQDVNIDPDASVSFLLNGGDDADSILLNYAGRMQGTFNAVLEGGSGDDSVESAEKLQPGSTPTPSTYVVLVLGEDDNDKLRLQVIPSSFSSAQIHARLNGGSGTNTGIWTDNVSAVNVN